jgi:hypothetical protein
MQIDKTGRQKISLQIDSIIRSGCQGADFHNFSRTHRDRQILADRVWENDAGIGENHGLNSS